jgi:hypothetical protein
MKKTDNQAPHIKKAQNAVIGSLLLLILCLTAEVRAQITVRGGNQTLNITTGMAGSEPIPVVNTSGSLRYSRQNTNNYTKITVQTVCPSQSFDLRVLAAGVVQGVAQPEVDLVNGMLAVDLIRDIQNRRPPNWNNTTITLQYTASATFAQGNSAELGNDVHTVTYTILVQ